MYNANDKSGNDTFDRQTEKFCRPRVIIQEYTTKKPITMIGEEAGVCWNSDVSDDKKNFKRGVACLESGHGRTFEFPDVYMILDGYSAKVIREWYTHVGGLPTRLQESTRYVDYVKAFDYVYPKSIRKNTDTNDIYVKVMEYINQAVAKLENSGVPREDASLLLPLGMRTKIVCKHNLRNLIDMSHQRLCTRAYHEYRNLFKDLCNALSEYSPEWDMIVKTYFVPKCNYLGYCPEKDSCNRNDFSNQQG